MAENLGGSVAATLHRALDLHRLGQLADAKTIYQSILAADPKNFDALHLLGTLRLQEGDPAAAIALIQQALTVNPDNPAARANLALALRAKQAALEQADAAFKEGNAQLQTGRLNDALANYDRALTLAPNHPAIHVNRGAVLLDLKRSDEALASYDCALALDPDNAAAHLNRGNALLALNRVSEALTHYDRAAAVSPDLPETHVNRGHALVVARRLDEAAAAYARALALRPDYDFLVGTLAHTRMKLCDWTDYASNVAKVRSGIADTRKVIEPLALLSLIDDPDLQLQATRIYGRARYPHATPVASVAGGAPHEKLRVGYYSSDFRTHPVAHLFTPLIEAHDRSRVEIFGFGFGPDTQDAIRARIEAACDKFFWVDDRSDAAVAELSHKLGIDVAVDLNGHTQYARTGMFAARCAPVQLSYIGYGGTMGMDCFDYLVSDATTIPTGSQSSIAEKVIYLPGSSLVNGARAEIAQDAFTRADLGLPDGGFVFCGFNNAYKIVPEVFAIWMRLLKAVDGAVLWLREDNKTAGRNLRKEAAARGVDPSRLVFARHMPLERHLARQRFADLFLDTLPYNAHSTASDALWAGLPVLTCAGRSFASRVAASLVTTLGLPELVTDTPEAYEAKALALARDPGQLAEIRRRMDESRLTSPLFDAGALARHLEAAYSAAHARAQAGLPPEYILVGDGI